MTRRRGKRRSAKLARGVARGEPRKDPKALVVVVTEGKVTEPQYLQEFERIHGHESVKVVPLPGPPTDPRSIVERAREEKRSAVPDGLTDRDTYWVMFDRDDHDRRRFHEALDMANANGIGLAVSIPCFELWVLLHYEDWNRSLHRDECRRRLTRHCDGYAHGRKQFDDIGAIEDKYDRAVDRARTLVQLRTEEDESVRNPSTTVHCLTEHIRRGVEPA